jgi:hypothetical protein
VCAVAVQAGLDQHAAGVAAVREYLDAGVKAVAASVASMPGIRFATAITRFAPFSWRSRQWPPLLQLTDHEFVDRVLSIHVDVSGAIGDAV